MVIKREIGKFLNLHKFSFLSVAIFLVIFSIIYGNIYVMNITGYAPEGENGENDPVIECPGDPECPQESSSPPEQVVEEVSRSVERVRESSEYASSVGQIISGGQVSESDLLRYKANLDNARNNAVGEYSSSSDILNKYSSSTLSEYQESMVEGISSIDRQLREIESMLTTSVTERFERQTELAEWEIETENQVEEGIDLLIAQQRTLIPIVIVGSSTFVIALSDPGVVQVERAIPRQAQITLTNNGQGAINNCVISTSGLFASWLQWTGFTSPIGPNSLASGQSGTYYITITAPGNAPNGVYLINFRVQCTEGQTDGFTLSTEVTGLQSQSGGGSGVLTQNQVFELMQRYLGQLTNECEDVLVECVFEYPVSCGQYSDIYECVANNNCVSFENNCLRSSEFLLHFLPYFINTYVTPFYNLPSQCIEDVTLCSISPSECPDYISTCTLNGQCQQYIEQCINVPETLQGSQGNGGFGGSSGGGSGIGINNANLIPVNPSAQGGIPGCEGDPLCERLAETCLTPSYIIATNLNLVNFGGFGYNPTTGQICYMGESGVYVRPNGLINLETNENEGKGSIIIHFQESTEEDPGKNYVAAVVYSLNGHLTLNFFNSPDYQGLEDKIAAFIQKLLYGDTRESYITGMSLQQAEEIVNESVSIPWLLWILLFVMVICFVLFGNTFSPYSEILIYSGRRALNKKEYAKAVEIYNKIAEKYPNNSDVKQDALNYLLSIKEKVNLSLSFSDNNSLPKARVSYK